MTPDRAVHLLLPTGDAATADPVSQPGADGRTHNSEFDWDQFDPERYHTDNYERLRDDDKQILETIRDFFASIPELRRSGPGAERLAIDVGTGPNIYPALAMLPYAEHVTLWERALPNIKWLEGQRDGNDERDGYSESWDAFWNVLAEIAPYNSIVNPRELFAKRSVLQHNDLFKLPQQHFDLGTMFFVAESMTRLPGEFVGAVGRFLGSLRRGAPFAIAFMEDSHGYEVGDQRYPAVPIGVSDVRACLSRESFDLTVSEPIGPGGSPPLRPDQEHMLIALGRARGAGAG